MNSEEEQGEQVERTSPMRREDATPIFDDIEEVIKKHGIEEAVFIFTSKDLNEPVLYWNQKHFYEAAKLLAFCMRQFKGKMLEDLDC